MNFDQHKNQYFDYFQTMVECAATASSVLPFRVRKMGWAVQLLEKSSSYSSETSFDSGMSDNTSTQLVFVAQTDEHVYLWDSVPWTIKEWAERVQTERSGRTWFRLILWLGLA